VLIGMSGTRRKLDDQQGVGNSALSFNKTKYTSTESPKRNFFTIIIAITLGVVEFHPHNYHLDAQ
jgi:hypothetical protein